MATPTESTAEIEPPPAVPHPKSRTWLLLSLIFAIIAAPAILWRLNSRRPAEARRAPASGRLFAKATSRNSHPAHIRLGHEANQLAISPESQKLFAIEGGETTLSVVNLATNSINEIDLGRRLNGLAVTPSGLLYIGGFSDGLIVWDIAAGRVRDFIDIQGGVMDLAATPDRLKLFIAMNMKGLKRLSTRTGELRQLTDRVCPQFLALDRSGSRLFVSYQCGGPSGKAGYDEAEIFDTARESPVMLLGGVPLVGGPITASPDGSLAVIDGFDVCRGTHYSHQGCPFVPASVLQVFRTADGHALRPHAFSEETGYPRFVDDSRLLVSGRQLAVLDARRYTTIERLPAGSSMFTKPILSPDSRRVFVVKEPKNEILAFDAEDPRCADKSRVAMMFTGDGTYDDDVGNVQLAAHGDVSFGPGKVGQAFILGGSNSFLSTNFTGYYQFGLQDAAIAFYVNLTAWEGEATLLYRMTAGEKQGMRLRLDADRHFIGEFALTNGRIFAVRSAEAVARDAWTHVAVSRLGGEVSLFLNGVQAASGSLGGNRLADSFLSTPLYIGAGPSGRSPMHGLVDEVAFYDHGLTAGDVRRLYEMRESEPCRP